MTLPLIFADEVQPGMTVRLLSANPDLHPPLVVDRVRRRVDHEPPLVVFHGRREDGQPGADEFALGVTVQVLDAGLGATPVAPAP